MKSKRFIILVVSAALVIAYFISLNLPNKVRRQQTFKALQGLIMNREQIDTAVQAFVHSRTSSNSIAPTTVSLRELVSGGYLSAKDCQGLEDRDVTISPAVNDRYPVAIWIRVRMADGRDIIASRDGGVMLVPPNNAPEPTATAP